MFFLFLELVQILNWNLEKKDFPYVIFVQLTIITVFAYFHNYQKFLQDIH